MQIRIVDSLAILLVFCIVFRGTLGVVGGVIGENLAFAVLYSSFLVLLMKRIRISKDNVFHYLFVLYCALIALIYPVFGWYGNYFTAFIGFSNLAAPILFWLMLKQCSIDTKKVIFGIWVILLINAIGALIQYFISSSVFGLVHHNVYSESEILEQGHVLKRAISFISSPQSLSIAMGVGVSITLYLYRGWKSFLLTAVFFIAGVLTISKAFYIYILVSLTWYFRARIRSLLFFIPLVLFLFLFSGDNEFLSRITKVFFYIQNIKEYSAFNIWVTSFSYVFDDFGYFFGRGIGVFSRGSQLMLDYQINTSAASALTTGSTESFIIQIIVELGFIGALLWLIAFISSIRGIVESKGSRNALISGILLSIFSVSFFTPALYGFVISVIFSFFLVNCNDLNLHNNLEKFDRGCL